jgi:hypothetical protein
MEWTLVLAISFAALLILGLIGAVIFLALLHTKVTTGQLRMILEQSNRRDSLVEGMLLTLKESLTEALETTSSSVSDSVADVLQAQKEMHQSSMATVTKSLESAMFGISSSAAEMSKLTKTATTLLGSKDPLAFQMAMGATAALDHDGGDEPYTSTQVDAEWEAQRARNVGAADAALRLMTDFLPGAPTNEPYDTVA